MVAGWQQIARRFPPNCGRSINCTTRPTLTANTGRQRHGTLAANLWPAQLADRRRQSAAASFRMRSQESTLVEATNRRPRERKRESRAH